MHFKKTACAIGILATVSTSAFLTACSSGGNSNRASNDEVQLSLEQIGQYAADTIVFDEGAAEIVAYDSSTERLFIVNANEASVDVINLADPSNPVKIGTITVGNLGDGVNSVAVYNGLVAVAIEADSKQDNGQVALYRADTLQLLDNREVGALPDMVTFTPNGKYVLVANEGEPSDDYKIDPEGSVSIVPINVDEFGDVVTAGFEDFDKADLLANGVNIYGPNATAAQDLEPEYITVSADSRYAYVALQENNAMAIVDILGGKITDVRSLGFKDHSLAGNELDASNKDDLINIRNWPVMGMYQPDAIASYTVNDETFIVTANEGDARDYWYDATEAQCEIDQGEDYEYDEDDGCLAFSEEARVKDLELDTSVSALAGDDLQDNDQLGRLKITTTKGDLNNDGKYESLFSYGARSISIFNSEIGLVYDSGSTIENVTAAEIPENFNSTNDENDSFEDRSDDKGPEPEGIAVGEFDGRTYAFVGLERVGGIMVFDITVPSATAYEYYTNNRYFSGNPKLWYTGDLGPEGLFFISEEESPNGEPLLIVGNEVSGTTTIYQVNHTFN